jgi:hypothetical protein
MSHTSGVFWLNSNGETSGFSDLHIGALDSCRDAIRAHADTYVVGKNQIDAMSIEMMADASNKANPQPGECLEISMTLSTGESYGYFLKQSKG